MNEKNKKNKILLVEDNPKIQQVNKTMLTGQGYEVYLAMTIAEAKKHLGFNSQFSSFNSQFAVDMIVLDIMLPDGNGVEFLRELRAAGRDIPVLFLTAMGTAEDMVAGLDAGGDDYLTKPYDYKVFMARIKTILRREQAANKRIKEAAEGKPDILTYGLLTINTVTRLAYRGKETLQLQTKQFGLLLLLAQRKNETLGTSYLYEAIWGQPMGNDVQALRKAISRIRSEIKGCGYSITSERDKGYRFEKGG